MTDDDRRRAILTAAFRMPSVQTMASRTSSITNAFVNAVIPAVKPTVEEIDEALRILGMDPADVRCAYCGDRSTEWDHLRPLVVDRRPTGYITEIANLVPACGKCNQSKGNKPWRTWIRGTSAKHSPTKRGIAGTDSRVERLEAFERWRQPRRLDFDSLLGAAEWDGYWKLWENLLGEMTKCQKVADALRATIEAAMSST